MKDNPKGTPGHERALELTTMYTALKSRDKKYQVLQAFLETGGYDSPIYDEILSFTKRSTRQVGGEWIPESQLRKMLGSGFKTAIKEGHYWSRVVTCADGRKSPSGALEYRKKIDRNWEEEQQERMQQVKRTKDADEGDLARVTRRMPSATKGALPLIPAKPNPKSATRPSPKNKARQGSGGQDPRTKTKIIVQGVITRANKLLQEVPGLKAASAKAAEANPLASRVKGAAEECMEEVKKEAAKLRTLEGKLCVHLEHEHADSFVADAGKLLHQAASLEGKLDL